MSKRPSNETWAPVTIAVRGGVDPETGAGLSPAIELSSTFVLAGEPTPGTFSYARAGSPAYAALERALAAIEGGSDAVVFNAGVAAAAALLEEAAPGTAVVMPEDAYFGIRVYAQEYLGRHGIEIRLIDTQDLDALDRALDGAGFLWTETPTNPLLAVSDLRAIGEIAAGRGVPWACDNTFATPILQRPLDFGATASMHSVTKYIAGHSDLIMGVAICRDADLAARLRVRRNTFGTQPDGFSCWLARRGMQTLPLRITRQSTTALELASRARQHPAVARVYYPGLPDAAGHAIARGQMNGGFGGMLSLLVQGGEEAAQAVVDACRLWVPATSLGGVESLIERRARWTGETADAALLRLSVGLEEVEDLWRDLDCALSSSS